MSEEKNAADAEATADAELLTESVSVMAPAPATPVAMRKQVEKIAESHDRFTPAKYLPVMIDFFTDSANPYGLSEVVVYDNGIVRVILEKGFKWDGASIPVWLPVAPWLATMLAMHLWPETWQAAWLLIVTVVLVLYTLRLLPYMQKMGLHARAMCVHDRLYRAQQITRLECDAIMASILESDGVPWDVRTLIYRRVRNFGWIAWMKNKAALAAANVGPAVIETKPPVRWLYVAYWLVAAVALVSLLVYLIGGFLV